MFTDHSFKKGGSHSFIYKHFLTTPICTAMGDGVERTSFYATSFLPFQRTTAATQVRLQTCCVLSALSAMPQASEKFHRVSYHESAKNRLLAAGNGTLAETNGKPRLDLQSVLPDWIL